MRFLILEIESSKGRFMQKRLTNCPKNGAESLIKAIAYLIYSCPMSAQLLSSANKRLYYGSL